MKLSCDKTSLWIQERTLVIKTVSLELHFSNSSTKLTARATRENLLDLRNVVVEWARVFERIAF
jgi:hypothetical protein